MSILFDEIVFGPVHSRRFGISLGMNLLPVSFKYCTFNCLYCECGWNEKSTTERVKLPARIDIYNALQSRLTGLREQNVSPDNITFAGNGEPTIHPEFGGIIDDTLALRNKYFPATKITVLSNASRIHNKMVFDALNKVDNNVLKLDTAIEDTFHLLNQPAPGIKLGSIIKNLKKFSGNQVIQTLFLRGHYNGRVIDNTTAGEIDAWIKVIKEIQPKYVMIYPIDRETPAGGLEKISRSELETIAARVNEAGIKTKIYD
jgi:wyosine [tRNA(Phe)-imidazoG37] synthetase (radical SAM superfamily)